MDLAGTCLFVDGWMFRTDTLIKLYVLFTVGGSNSVNLLRYCFKVQCSNTCILLEYFHLMLLYTFTRLHFRGNIVLSTPLHLFDSLSH